MDEAGERRRQGRIPVTVLTGFLGAGKTTLLNRWLRGCKPGEVAVLVNEFGEVGVDGALLHAEGRLVEELTDGCICCVVQESLITSLALVAARGPARIFLETSGLAEPAPVIEALQYGNLPRMIRHALTVTAVDPLSLPVRLAEPVVLRQIACADRIVLTRADLASPRQLDDARLLVSRINPLAQVRLSSMGQLDGDDDLDSWIAGRMRLLARAPQPAPPHEHAADVRSVAFEHPGPIDPDRLGLWLDALALALGDDLFRCKGLLALEGSPRVLVLQGVGPHFDLREGPLWGDLPPTSRLVLIGRSLEQEALRRGFFGCVR
jgi:G3E family GTPase